MLPDGMMLIHHASGLQVPLSTLVIIAGVLALFSFLYIIAKHLPGMAALKDARSEPRQCFSTFVNSRVPSRFWTASDEIIFDTER